MNIRKIVMVEPKAPGKHIFSRFLLPRLGLPILGTLAANRGIDVSIYVEEFCAVDFNKIVEADLLCISSITSTAPAAYRLASQARMAGVPVVIGGPHITFLADEALNHVDWVLRGEGEKSFLAFLDMLEGRLSPGQVNGLSYRAEGQTIHNPLAPTMVSMDEVPIPDFGLLAGSKKKFHRGIIPMQISRGCPHECRFCSVTPMFGRKMRFASKEHVAAELESRRGKGDMVFFYDDNFCASPKRTKELLEHLMSRDVFLPPWLCQVSVRAARDEELLKMMQRAGCHTVFVGFESIQPEALEIYRKRQSVDDIRQAVRRFHKYGIRVHGMFMTGSDAEGVDTIRATAQFAIDEDIETIQFLILTPLPGTPLYEDLDRQNRLITNDWSLYDTMHSVFRPTHMSSFELMDESFTAMAKVYELKRVLGMLARGQFHRSSLNLYAHFQVKRWRRENRKLLKTAKRAARRHRIPSSLPT
ncbi:MAG: B12-binding domain-containing radical SAM protein [Deltaproteobacteria bacterium]|nr:B12-binding domain-containing radical SAM protein [Deltaproteobacteria bacterium]